MKREPRHVCGCEFIKLLTCIPLTLQDSFFFLISWKLSGNSPVEAIICCTILEMLEPDKRKLPIVLGQLEGVSKLLSRA